MGTTNDTKDERTIAKRLTGLWASEVARQLRVDAYEGPQARGLEAGDVYVREAKGVYTSVQVFDGGGRQPSAHNDSLVGRLYPRTDSVVVEVSLGDLSYLDLVDIVEPQHRSFSVALAGHGVHFKPVNEHNLLESVRAALKVCEARERAGGEP